MKNGDAEPPPPPLLLVVDDEDFEEDVLNESLSESPPGLAAPNAAPAALPLDEGEEGMWANAPWEACDWDFLL